MLPFNQRIRRAITAERWTEVSGMARTPCRTSGSRNWTWGQVTFGEEGSVYPVPQDSGPMAMFYRVDLFKEAGLEVPTTWEEYATAAEQIKARGSYITNFPRSDVNWFAGNVWQAGGQ